MELGQYQLQIFVSLTVILGAAFVALICDLLKGNNEQLRELAIELKVRREEEQKHFQMMMPRVAVESSRPAEVAAAPVAEVEAPVEATAEIRMERKARPRAAAVGAVGSKERKRPIAAEALAVMERGAQMASAPRPRRRAEQTEAAAEVTMTEAIVAAVKAPETWVAPEVEILSAAPAAASLASTVASAPAKRKPTVTISRDWGSLLNAKKDVKESVLLDAVMAATASDATAQASEPMLPAGFQDGFVLSKLVASRQPVSGLVVSIGASATYNADGSVQSNVRALIQSLLGPNDFAAQSGAEEFLLIFPGERGASAQRRLSQVAQQLWDFQLRSLGSFSILFSWGGVEVRSESIDEAIASATERMEETRRGRKVLSMESSRRESEAPLAQAV